MVAVTHARMQTDGSDILLTLDLDGVPATPGDLRADLSTFDDIDVYWQANIQCQPIGSSWRARYDWPAPDASRLLELRVVHDAAEEELLHH